jgi:hypothetical protein
MSSNLVLVYCNSLFVWHMEWNRVQGDQLLYKLKNLISSNLICSCFFFFFLSELWSWWVAPYAARFLRSILWASNPTVSPSPVGFLQSHTTGGTFRHHVILLYAFVLRCGRNERVIQRLCVYSVFRITYHMLNKSGIRTCTTTCSAKRLFILTLHCNFCFTWNSYRVC